MLLFEFDKDYRDKFGLVCGVDEAGRGPLAGDVYAAAVVFDEDVTIDGLNDSKKLSAKKREKLFDEIIEKARAYSIAAASVEEIESLNILEATFLAMKRAVDGLGLDFGLVLVDGNKKPPLQYPVETVIKGDSLSASIAAASILAKVSRDRYMKTLAEKYPQYEFSKHKGYGTARHRELILKYGPCEIHRKSFLKKLFKNG
ncbi:MAG: Ribonuclease [Oscillospiraceae bacterium]|jgi:ribonuclease HII|nr:Ribonuclease [Oscillospiraceae bacterium]